MRADIVKRAQQLTDALEGQRFLTQEEVETLKYLWEQGFKADIIAKAMNCHKNTVFNWRRKLKLQSRMPPRQQAVRSIDAENSPTP